MTMSGVVVFYKATDKVGGSLPRSEIGEKIEQASTCGCKICEIGIVYS